MFWFWFWFVITQKLLMDFHESWMEDGSRLRTDSIICWCRSGKFMSLSSKDVQQQNCVCEDQLDFKTEHDQVADSFCITAK